MYINNKKKKDLKVVEFIKSMYKLKEIKNGTDSDQTSFVFCLMLKIRNSWKLKTKKKGNDLNLI